MSSARLHDIIAVMHTRAVNYYRRSHASMFENIADFEAFFTSCAKDLPSDFVAWKHSTTPALVGLELFGFTAMLPAGDNPYVGIGLLVLAAQNAFPLVAEIGGDQLADAAFFAEGEIDDDPTGDGAPLETQLATVAGWLEGTVDAKAIEAVYDFTRQLYVWDDDIRPSDDQAFMWLTEVGQCACAAILNKGGDQSDRGYYGWPPSVCVGRGLVAVVRALTPAGADVADVYNRLFKPLQVVPRGSPSQQPLTGARKKSAPQKTKKTKKAAPKKAVLKKAARKKPAAKKRARTSKR